MNILLTGGAGYIGSHTAIALSEAGYTVTILDNFSNSHKSVLDRLEKIIGKKLAYINGDVRDTTLLIQIFERYKFNAVIHFAGLKSVGESIQLPIEYYANNVEGTISLIQALKVSNVKTLIFSSSATVYGDPKYVPLDEEHPIGPTNPYGRTKLHTEEMLKDLAGSDPSWRIVCLRYFNPVGAHHSGLIGEEPKGVPNNLLPFIAQVAAGKLSVLNVYGNDYPTTDGTGVRDYIHVVDLAKGHLAALNYASSHAGWEVFNLGTGHGFSVFEMLKAFELVSGKRIPYILCERRPGDVASCFADVKKAKELLDWHAEKLLDDICLSSWSWQKYRVTLS